MARNSRSNLITVELIIVHETAKAILVKDDEKSEGIWLPKSQVSYDKDDINTIIEVEMEEHLAIEHEFI